MSSSQSETNDIILETSLQAFFYDQLHEVNKKNLNPLPNESVYYSSLIMDHFGESQKYFEVEEGKVREKILGTKLLESSGKPRPVQKRMLRDIGDTALFMCGYFSDSVNKKLIDLSYYHELGRIAYRRLNSYIPELYDYPEFYDLLSDRFQHLAEMIYLVSKQNEGLNTDDAFLIVDRKTA
jgi:hypothetical protein